MRIKTKLIAAAAVAGLALGLLPIRALAATGVIYISPSSVSIQKNSSFTVSLRINPGTSVDTVQATVGYSTAALQFESLTIGAFSTCVQDSGGGGSVTYACTKLGSSTSSDSLIGTITFKALAGGGSSALAVSNADAARDGTSTGPSASGATVHFTSPPAPKKTTGNSSSLGSSSSTAKSSSVAASPTSKSSTAKPNAAQKTTPKATAGPAAPKVTLGNLTVSNIQFTTATVNLVANTTVQALAQCGTGKNDLNLTTPLSASSKTPSINLGMSLTPGTTYYCQAVAKDSSGKVLATSAISSFTTEGFTVKVTVLDSKYRPLANTTVGLHSTPMQAKTNSSGIATFTDVAPGLHHAEYTIDGHAYSQPVYVADNITTNAGGQTAPAQTAAVVLAGYVQPHHAIPLRIVAFLGLILVGAVVFETRHKLGARLQPILRHMPKPPTTPTTTDY